MKKILVAGVLIVILVAFAVNLQAKNFMWEVQGGKNKAYLLGSNHTMPKDVYPLDEQIEKAFEESDKLVVEVDATSIDQQEVNNYIVMHAIYRDSMNLKTVLPDDVYKTVNEEIMELGFQDDQVKVYKPWFVSINLSLGALQKIDVEKDQGIDLHFLNKAKEREMPVLELETAISQFKALSSMDEDVQKDVLINSLAELDDIPKFFDKLLIAWKDGDADKMNELSRLKILEAEEELPGIRDYYNELFLKRDKKIVEKIADYLESEEENTYFIIVGAVHLVGEDGLLQMLQDKDYKIVQD
ncbi:MAG: TraB/GumN family protein [Candidatus Cloacimonetes bacterium]|nr:TraB/GumN family protein [Candidatus Cloacimonadota bacterium]MCF7814142.1 TraB/GumN family protein [Candidatus Cloacimonadota bacterium]MCF7868709.1 TraB/GumN family protein [Candidatus Cloacimonadota bacterium]MCF7884141.1 TraB/GumN family protein [Candidatus Cloacimonadota bacterium]